MWRWLSDVHLKRLIEYDVCVCERVCVRCNVEVVVGWASQTTYRVWCECACLSGCCDVEVVGGCASQTTYRVWCGACETLCLCAVMWRWLSDVHLKRRIEYDVRVRVSVCCDVEVVGGCASQMTYGVWHCVWDTVFVRCVVEVVIGWASQTTYRVWCACACECALSCGGGWRMCISNDLYSMVRVCIARWCVCACLSVCCDVTVVIGCASQTAYRVWHPHIIHTHIIHTHIILDQSHTHISVYACVCVCVCLFDYVSVLVGCASQTVYRVWHTHIIHTHIIHTHILVHLSHTHISLYVCVCACVCLFVCVSVLVGCTSNNHAPPQTNKHTHTHTHTHTHWCA